ncbi:endonuclease/exonuclease/phosphatase family protein [Devosia sp.]|uniref:endonuclease/exonuclease/phosphatase family protein n=1 Tax=Devosia sp. TaxID=1871048 RepID=UPI002FC965B9
MGHHYRAVQHGRAKLTILSEIRGVLSGLAIVAVALLLAVSIPFGMPGQELLSTLRFHLGIALLALPLLLALSGARLRSLVMLGLVLASLAQGAGMVFIQQGQRAAFAELQPRAGFRALSFNVLAANPRRADAARYIMDSNADVVVVMEAGGLYGLWPEIMQTYPYRLGCEPENACDLAILSRTPFVSAQRHLLYGLERWRLSQATVMFGGEAVTVVGLHLTKPYFDRVAELELVQARSVIGAIEGPVLLMGDFNAAAWSNQVAGFAAALDLVPPPTYPATWPVELGPFGVPIDNMFTRGAALIRTIGSTPEAFGSNHLGLLATVELF